jgi:plastocyanin
MARRVGARGLAIAILVLAAIVATPALSAAQDTGTETAPPEPILSPEQPSPPADAVEPSGEPGDANEAEPAGDTPAPPPAAPAPAETRSAGGGVARAAASASVSVGDNFYSPASVSISVGDTVTWANNGQAQHSATANNGSFDTGVFGPGSSRSQTFNRAGTFSYFCTVHGQSQSGTVRVLAASGGGGKGGGGSAGSSAAGTTEAAAVASPDAAGTSTSLAATGLEALGLTAIGLALLGAGIALGRRLGLGFQLPLL